MEPIGHHLNLQNCEPNKLSVIVYLFYFACF
jgi:hypothetical protein